MLMRRNAILLLLISSLFAAIILQAISSSVALHVSDREKRVAATAPWSENLLCTSPCARTITGWLHTNPNNLDVYDSNGSVVRLQGVNVDGLDFGTGGSSSNRDSCGKGWSIPTSSFANVASWGFNFVRVPISWENLEPTPPTLATNGSWIHHWNTPYLNELDLVVEQFEKVHVAVIFDFAQVDVSSAFQQAPEKVQGGECEGWGNPTWLYPKITSPTNGQQLAAAMCNFFNDLSVVGNMTPPPIEAMEAAEGMVASRYAGAATVIGIDIFNEPWFDSSCGSVASEGALLTSFYTKMGRFIAEENPHLLLVFEDTTPGLMHSAPIINSPPSISNSVYEFHIYTSGWRTAQPYVQAFLDKAKNWGIPMWLGEFDAFEAGCTGSNCFLDPNWQSDTQALLAFCNSQNINWAYFSYYSLGTNIRTPVSHAAILATLRSEITP
jgi:hypothetical protein